MRAVRDGDVAKLGVLFERHHRPVFEFLVRMTGDRTAAEDLVQDVFVRMLKYRATYRDVGSFETWMFRIARNARADYFQDRRATTLVSDAGVDVPSAAPGQLTLKPWYSDFCRAVVRAGASLTVVANAALLP